MNIFLTQFWNANLLIHKLQPRHITILISIILISIIPNITWQQSSCFPAAHQLLIRCSPAAHQILTSCSPAARQMLTSSSSDAHHLLTSCSPAAHQLLINCSPAAYQLPPTTPGVGGHWTVALIRGCCLVRSTATLPQNIGLNRINT